eukprot:TRINITY_DN3355_c1_g1_i3.p1 TRINITY_DN3355_c1_g1~~TRINITY_DN3355_c1_g1_i3.p1  ORF type:complete len:126 (-),score=38.58 TRINITY_DN3355_c1_g1_i3:86-463(-)
MTNNTNDFDEEYITIVFGATNTEQDEDGNKTFTTYEIVTQTNNPEYPQDREIKVHRRYNDFIWLYNRLKEEYELTKNRKDPVPAPIKPPTKKVFGRFKPSFVEKRKLSLEAWMNKLANHPVWPGF